jgi:hypothetical protein
MLSRLQSQLLALAADGPVRHSAALQKIFGLVLIPGKRGRMVFDYSQPATKTARATLHRSIDRLVSRGLVQYVPHGYKLRLPMIATKKEFRHVDRE